MNRKTFTFEEFGDLYSSLIIKGMYQIGLKEYMWRYAWQRLLWTYAYHYDS